jgi:hypothetical protein
MVSLQKCTQCTENHLGDRYYSVGTRAMREQIAGTRTSTIMENIPNEQIRNSSIARTTIRIGVVHLGRARTPSKRKVTETEQFPTSDGPRVH